ncbi:unnamed protein product [Brassicogethes aeneus]|uniref:Cuticle protein 6 n=1 Tax=Brassicogethes aeneus TaxID=1431903 RepID=A0A9P0B4G9_BRAAE|nr:unnamed protein product [Brassicogethes aeneus]
MQQENNTNFQNQVMQILSTMANAQATQAQAALQSSSINDTTFSMVEWMGDVTRIQRELSISDTVIVLKAGHTLRGRAARFYKHWKPIVRDWTSFRKDFEVAGVAVSKPNDVVNTMVVPVAEVLGPVASQYHAQDGLGQYTYGYSNPLSSKNEIKTVDGVTRGEYSYVDPEGKLQSVEYIADAVQGFRVAASNLPISPKLPVIQAPLMPIPVSDTPEVAESKAKHLAALEEAKIKIANAEVKLKANNNEVLGDISSRITNAAPLIQTYRYSINPIYGIYPHNYAHLMLPLYKENPQITPYIAYPVSSYQGNYIIGHSTIVENQLRPALPMAPTDLLEVVKAKNEHFAAIKKIKT